MSASTITAFSRRLFAALSLGTLGFVAAPAAHAVTISSSFTLPFNPTVTTESQPTLGTFDFSTALAGSTVSSFTNINITLSFFGLDTDYQNAGQAAASYAGLQGQNPAVLASTGGFDFNNITLSLAGGDTGIFLNGFGNGFNTLSFSATPTNAAAILAALNSGGHTITVGLLDTTLSPTNPFAILGGTASLSFEGATAVPFTPVETLGYSLIALAFGARELKRRGLLKLAFVPRA